MAGPETPKFGEGSNTSEVLLRTLDLTLQSLKEEIEMAEAHPELQTNGTPALRKKGVRENLLAMVDEMQKSLNLHRGIIEKIE